MKAEIIDINNRRNAVYSERYEEYGAQLGLELAVIAGDLDGVCYLVEECGADPRENRCYPFYDAVAHNHLLIVKFLFTRFQIDVDSHDGELLCVAAKKADQEMITYLIDEAGCDVNVSNGRPLFCAIEGGQIGNVRLLIERYGADDGQGMGKALVEAVASDQLHIVRYLVEEVGAGIELNIHDAVRLAWNRWHGRIASYLSQKLTG